MKDDVLIEFDNVTFAYDPEEPPALKDVSFQVKKGEFLSILGHNGSGKSTVARLCNAILVPSQGTICVLGLNTAESANEIEIRKNVGVVFQNPDNQIVATIVEEDVAFGPENLNLPPKEIRSRVDDALAAVNMSEYAKHETHRLSGGQKQRVAIAGIIAMRPKCIVFDEPTAMLDPIGRRDVMQTVLFLNREYGITVLYVTHFMEEAAQSDRILLLNSGRIAALDSPETVFADTKLLRSCGIDLPDAAKLAESLRKNGVPLPASIYREPDLIAALLALLRQNTV